MQRVMVIIRANSIYLIVRPNFRDIACMLYDGDSQEMAPSYSRSGIGLPLYSPLPMKAGTGYTSTSLTKSIMARLAFLSTAPIIRLA